MCFCVNKRSLVLLILSMFKMQFIGPTIGGEEIFLASLLIVGIRVQDAERPRDGDGGCCCCCRCF